MSPSQHILIYAELLSNIRQVSVGCTLPTPVSTTTRAAVSADGLALTVTHNGCSETVKLPKTVAPSSRLPIKESGGTSLSWRLPLAASLTGRILAVSDESVPWSATDLEPGSAVVCRTCQSTIVDAGTLKVWKDLPSENWAEMMEFWHCHKPHSHTNGNNEGHLTNRGYGASSRITAQPGVGFVDLTSFLLENSDLVAFSIECFLLPMMAPGLLDPKSTIWGPTLVCLEDASVFHREFSWTWKSWDYAEISASEGTNGAGNATKATITLHCASCKTQLGVQNDETSSVSIFKWQVVVKQTNLNIPESYPNLAQCVSAMLLATMARSGCSKSVLLPIKARPSLSLDSPKPEDSSQVQDLLNIWVFNANITFSSTEAPASPTNAAKVFYRMVSQKEADKMVESITSDVQDISLPSEAIVRIAGLLQKSNYFVPESDRKFKEWTVGLLEKWDGKGG